jgi:hypothetical protein
MWLVGLVSVSLGMRIDQDSTVRKDLAIIDGINAVLIRCCAALGCLLGTALGVQVLEHLTGEYSCNPAWAFHKWIEL